jgi:50S ribosomal protein L16 3-hydroxylase
VSRHPARSNTLLGGLTPAQFLKRHWQKSPLLVRQALPGFVDPVTPDELAGLALEADIESRLIFEQGRKRPWQLERGPFPEKTLRGLPRSHWTLLVQGVDRWLPGSSALLDQFGFVPGWRLDDLMVSFAPPMGTVGPHIDTYDVFLIQGQGRRRWQVQAEPDPTLVKGLDLKILKRFEPDAEWVLEPGDMLYVPPGVAHYGVALEDCLTYSVGFRAPSHYDLISELLQLPPELVESWSGEELYADPDLEPAANAGEIDAASVRRLLGIVRRPLEDPEVLARWLGRFATQVKAAPEAGRRPAPAKVEAAVKAGRGLLRNDHGRIAYAALGGGVAVFVNGEEITVASRELRPLIELICGQRAVDGAALARALPKGKAPKSEALALIGELLRRRSVELSR